MGIQAARKHFACAGKFGVADEPPAPKLSFDSHEKISFDGDQCKASGDREPGWARGGEQRVPEMPEHDAAARPRRESRKPECGANASSPEGIEGVKNQPIDWYGQFKEKNKAGDGVKETHLTRFLIFFREQSMYRRVADHAENKKRSSQ